MVVPLVQRAPRSRAASASCNGARSLASAPFSSGGLSTSALASEYDLDPLYRSGDLGAGATVALVEFGRFRPRDVARFVACTRTHARLRTIVVDGGPSQGSSSSVREGGLEADIDVEEVMALLPRGNVVVVEGADATATDILDTYSAAVATGADVISTSWGSCEQEIPASFAQGEAQIFTRAAELDETVVAAAGDDGSADCYDGKSTSTELAVDDPASQPYVTGVGGTEIGKARAHLAQRVWNQGPSVGAGGGGLSSLWAMPSYQDGLVARAETGAPAGTCVAALGTCRAVPDVSADAGTPVVVYCTESPYCSGWSVQEGTSIAAPLWASIFALSDASVACDGVRIGFADPLLYAIAAGSGRGAALSDIVVGNNDLTEPHLAFPALGGYDLASGLGAPIAGDGHDGRLVAQLCARARDAAGSSAGAS